MALFLMGYNFTLRVSTVYCKFLIARSLGQTWGPSGADRTQVGPMMTPWTLLSWMISVPYKEYPKHFVIPQLGTYSIWQSDWVSTCREMFNCCPPLHHPVFSPINMLVHASILEIAFETLWNLTEIFVINDSRRVWMWAPHIIVYVHNWPKWALFGHLLHFWIGARYPGMIEPLIGFCLTYSCKYRWF